MNKIKFIHRFVSPVMFVFLTISIVTAFMETLCKDILQVESPEIIMKFHIGRFFSDWTVIPSGIIFTSIYLIMLISGLPMFRFPWTKDFWDVSTVERLHGFFGTFLFTFLLISCLTGFSYSILKYIFKIEPQYIQWILIIHGFSFTDLTQIFYVNFMMILIVLLIVGGVASYFRFWIQTVKKMKKKDGLKNFDDEDVEL
jgi:hypothetical protein